jgi:hypothetical protein
LVFIITPAIPHGAFKMKVTFCVTAVFTPVLAKHSKRFSLEHPSKLLRRTRSVSD